MGTALDTVNEFIARINAGDLEGALHLCHPDIEYDNVPMGKNLGVDATREFLAPMVDGMDSVHWMVHREAETGKVVCNERTDRFLKGDRHADIPVMGVWEVDDGGLITLWRDYFDMSAVAEVGALFA